MQIGVRVRVLETNEYDDDYDDSEPRFAGLEGTIIREEQGRIPRLFIVALDDYPAFTEGGWALYETELEAI